MTEKPKENEMSALLEELIWEVAVISEKTGTVTVVNKGLTHAQGHTIKSKMTDHRWRRIVVRQTFAA